MLAALALSLQQLFHPSLLRILLKCFAITLVAFLALGVGGWWAIDAALAWGGLNDAAVAGSDGIRGLAALLLAVIGGWLLWRIVALAVLQFYADEVVVAVEARHYPDARAGARALGWRRELAVSARGVLRALGYNLLALPVALVLLVTGVGTAIVFFTVNALLLGRELTEMVWMRHAHAPDAPLPLGRIERFTLGGIVALLFLVPVANFLAPVLGAATATHLVHRKRSLPDAP